MTRKVIVTDPEEIRLLFQARLLRYGWIDEYGPTYPPSPDQWWSKRDFSKVKYTRYRHYVVVED